MLYVRPVCEKEMRTASLQSPLLSSLNLFATSSPQGEKSLQHSFLFLPFHLAYRVCTYATVLASPVVYPLTRWIHPHLTTQLSRLIDQHWDALPALTQTILYEHGYRNVYLEGLPAEQRRAAFPPLPPQQLSTRRLLAKSAIHQDFDTQLPPVATVFGWPSSGGLWAKDASLDDLASLGIVTSHHEITGLDLKPAIRPDDEDAFCHELCRVGAHFYPSIESYRLSNVPRLGYDEQDLEM